MYLNDTSLEQGVASNDSECYKPTKVEKRFVNLYADIFFIHVHPAKSDNWSKPMFMLMIKYAYQNFQPCLSTHTDTPLSLNTESYHLVPS